tara:strand:- start:6685 stop:7533 length:849 start_codon:yes stop_codon:yes gene_type:complete
MSSLNKLIEKLAGGDSSAVAESVETATSEQNITDPVYVEKLASAVDFIVDNMESLEEPVNKPTQDEKVAIIKEALSRDPSTGRFVSDKAVAPPTPESATPDITSNVTDITQALRDRLQAKLVTKQEAAKEVEIEKEQVNEASEAKQELLKNVLDKLKGRQPTQSAEDKDVSEENNENFYSGSSEDSVPEEEIFNDGKAATDEETEESVSNEADGEAAVKAASAGHSLADVLNAALSSDGQLNESTSAGAETEDVHGSEGPMARKQATDNLKKKLMAKIGKEA